MVQELTPLLVPVVAFQLVSAAVFMALVPGLDFGTALGKAKESVHLSLYANATSKASAWHLPRAHWIEPSWNRTLEYLHHSRRSLSSVGGEWRQYF